MQTGKLLSLFVQHFPEFQARWDSPANLHREGPSFTAHGLCAEFSTHFIECTSPQSEAVASFFATIEEIIAKDPLDEDLTANALCTCFLENIAQTIAGRESIQYMGPASKKYFDSWNVEP